MTFKPREKNPSWNGGVSVNANGYKMILVPEHPRAQGKGYVPEHILIAEKALGKPLPKGAVVHHVDEQRGKIKPLALVVCPDNVYHHLLHQRARAFDACGNANWRKCRICKNYDDPQVLYINGTTARHRECMNREWRERSRKKKP